MSELTHRQTTPGTDLLAPIIPNPNSNHRRINAMMDFFRARTTTRIVVPSTAPTPSGTAIPQPAAPASDPIRPELIPIQVIMEHPLTTAPRDATNEAAYLVPIISPPTPPQNPQARLHQAQTLWAAMFCASDTPNVVEGNRPIILSIENQRANTSWGDKLTEKQLPLPGSMA
jgi:hypothetical protein